MASNNPHFNADPEEIKLSQGQEPGSVRTFLPRGLNIVWGNDSRYWRIPNKGDPSPVAELLQVSWLEVTGSIDVEPNKKYQITFQLSLKPDAFGWSGCPVYLMAKAGKRGRYQWRKVDVLKLSGQTGKTDIPDDNSFTIPMPPNSNDNKLYFGLYEVWSGKWKGGLLIHSATVKETQG